jgi:curved DNA-binding protein CbpA
MQIDLAAASKIFKLKNEFYTSDQIKKLYRKLAKENHPDTGGDTEKMKEINVAYQVFVDYFETRGNHYFNAFGYSDSSYSESYYSGFGNSNKSERSSEKEDKEETKTSSEHDDLAGLSFEEIIAKILALKANNLLMSILRTEKKNYIRITGNSYPYKDQIKAMGFKFKMEDKMWQWTADSESV